MKSPSSAPPSSLGTIWAKRSRNWRCCASTSSSVIVLPFDFGAGHRDLDVLVAGADVAELNVELEFPLLVGRCALGTVHGIGRRLVLVLAGAHRGRPSSGDVGRGWRARHHTPERF